MNYGIVIFYSSWEDSTVEDCGDYVSIFGSLEDDD